MIAVDTNVLVRYFAQDDPAQSHAAVEFFEATLTPTQQGFISIAVLLEVSWVLRSAYGASPDRIRQIVSVLLQTPTIIIERQNVVRGALAFEDQQLSDALIHLIGLDMGCSTTGTFDRRLAQMAGVTLLTG
jgi:predicted nucleic-acid-binding protein